MPINGAATGRATAPPRRAPGTHPLPKPSRRWYARAAGHGPLASANQDGGCNTCTDETIEPGGSLIRRSV